MFFLRSLNQGEPGMEGEAGPNGPDGAKASWNARHAVTQTLIYPASIILICIIDEKKIQNLVKHINSFLSVVLLTQQTV